MSVLDIMGKITCPICNEKKISAWYFDMDCRGNPSSSGAEPCSSCGFIPTKDFLSKICSMLRAERDRK